ncbi:MAG: AEC family transporter [Prochloraceae cyanobacterium]
MYVLSLKSEVLQLYERLSLPILLGILIGLNVSNNYAVKLGKLLFSVGIPIVIAFFLHNADLDESVWIASIIAWIAVSLGGFIAWIWIRRNNYSLQKNSLTNKKAVKGSFVLASMAGNTRYFGFPIILMLIGQKYFGWAVFYDLMSSTIGSYGLGIIIAAYCNHKIHNYRSFISVAFKNPALWGLGIGLCFRQVPLNEPVEVYLSGFAWTIVSLSLMLVGMRLSQLDLSWRNLKLALITLTIKMLVVPLMIGTIVSLLGIDDSTRLLIVLLAAMPPAISTLIIAETYNLDRQLTVTTIAAGSLILPLTLPLWLQLFGV